jgi:GNAT superfamily N-acetyltransferase
MNFEPQETGDPEVLERIYRFRVQWLLEGISPNPFPCGFWKDEHDEHAKHWVVMEGERLLAVARLCVHEKLSDVPGAQAFDGLNFEAVPPIASINRLAIHPEARGMGLSRKMDYARLSMADSLGCRTVVAFTHAGESRIKSLERRGFAVISPINFRSQFPFGLVTALVLRK